MNTHAKMAVTAAMTMAAAGCGTMPEAPADKAFAHSYRGKMQVRFAAGAAAIGSSDGDGMAAMRFTDNEDAAGVAAFEGALPGFSDWGAACAFVDLRTQTVSGTIVEPDGTTVAFAELFDEVTVAPLPDSRGFEINSAIGEDRWTYRMELQPHFIGDSGQGVYTHVVVHRAFADDGETVFSERGGGGFTGSPIDLHSPAMSLRPAPPLMIDAGDDQTIRRGESASLSATVWGGEDEWQVYWSSPGTLNDAEHPEPFASPTVTTTYEVIARGPAGEEARDMVTVFVEP